MTLRMLPGDDDHDRIKIMAQSIRNLEEERHTMVMIWMIRVCTESDTRGP